MPGRLPCDSAADLLSVLSSFVCAAVCCCYSNPSPRVYKIALPVTPGVNNSLPGPQQQQQQPPAQLSELSGPAVTCCRKCRTNSVAPTTNVARSQHPLHNVDSSNNAQHVNTANNTNATQSMYINHLSVRTPPPSKHQTSYSRQQHSKQ